MIVEWEGPRTTGAKGRTVGFEGLKPASPRPAKVLFLTLQSRKVRRVGTVSLALCALLGFGAVEIQTSYLQSHLLASVARQAAFSVKPGPAETVVPAANGPYDQRLGYASIPKFVSRLQSSGFEVEAQARGSRVLQRMTAWGLFPIHREKSQAGLRVLDRDGRELFAAKYPQRVFGDFDAIPPQVISTLLFIENRELLKPGRPYQNPAVEWDRLAIAVFGLGLHKLYPNYPVVGGSTLATQLEKVRHSPGGYTGSVGDKMQQMASASVRAYQDGQRTIETQKRIVRDYVNSIPLAAIPGHGEVTGLGDGLWVWFGADLNEVNRLLRADENGMTESELRKKALAYRQVLSLLLALNKPSRYLLGDPEVLRHHGDHYLQLVAEAGIISPGLRDLALEQQLVPRKSAPDPEEVDFVERKATHSIRAALIPLLDVQGTYDLDRLDLGVHTTLDLDARDAVTAGLRRLSDPEGATEAGLRGEHLLRQGDPSSVIYSFALYERGSGVNLLRVQTDNYDQPLNINEGTKLELGSTAKLRTLVTYLQIVAALHAEYKDLPRAELDSIKPEKDDRLTAWAVDYLRNARNYSLDAMLEGAMQRRYSASPGEGFFTGGGLHYFDNFDRKDNGRILTVREAMQRSVNLVFIRLMRDVVHHYMFRVPGSSPRILQDANDPRREAYLTRFADEEGKLFLRRFYAKYRGQTPGQALDTLLDSPKMTPKRAAVIFGTVRPRASVDQFADLLARRLPESRLDEKEIARVFEKYGPAKFNLSDSGYLARVHPLELWLLRYLREHPGAELSEVLARGAPARQEVYRWLAETEHKGAQDLRIRTLLEKDAFKEIHRGWRQVGYPFESLVPSYATTIGSSGDTPAALAELMGIIVNGGVRNPIVRISKLHFAAATPHETLLERKIPEGKRVLQPQVAALVRKELIGVVEHGTGRRAYGAVLLDGKPVAIGGKTGTGDNRFESYGPHGQRIDSRVVNRTATFVFLVGDRFFGTVTAYVSGEEAAGYSFTSALPVQIFRHLLPSLKPLLERAPEGRSRTLLISLREETG